MVRNYYKIALFVGFSDRDLIEGVFNVPGNTKVLDPCTCWFINY